MVNNLHIYVLYVHVHVLLKLWLQSIILAVTGYQQYWDFAFPGIDAVKRFVITTSILEMTTYEIKVKLAKLMGNMTWYSNCQNTVSFSNTKHVFRNATLIQRLHRQEAQLENFHFVIFHVGTNDIGNRASKKEILSDFGNIIGVCRKIKPSINICISAILPRPIDHSITDFVIREVNFYNKRWVKIRSLNVCSIHFTSVIY